MSSKKRKEPPKGMKGPKEAPSPKRTKTKASEPRARSDKPKSSAKNEPKRQPEPQKSSILKSLKDEEPMFKRGGGSILTPLERRKVQLQAEEDARAEDELEDGAQTKAKKRKMSEKPIAKRPKKSVPDTSTEPSVKVESLSFKVGRIPPNAEASN
jgi:rRNA biogenesis protein RRP5